MIDAETPQPEDVQDPVKVARNARQSLETLLRKTRAGYEAPRVFEASLWFLATCVAVFLSAGLIAAVVPRPHGPTVFGWILGIGWASAVVAAMIAALVAYRRRATLARIAVLLQSAEPGFRSDITSSLQFSSELETGDVRYSREMAAEHVQRTLKAMLGRVDQTGSLAHLLPSRSVRPALMALGGGVVFSAMLVGLVPNFSGRVLGDIQISGGPVSRPIVSDIDIILNFPAYTNRPAESEAFSTGNIDALAGTEVTLRTFPMLEASRFEILMKTDGQERIVPVHARDMGVLEARFVATTSGTYMFRATLADGKVVDDGIERVLNVKPDMPPRVSVSSHGGEVEVTPGEVLEIVFEASDDYGLHTIARLYGMPGEEPTRVAPTIPALNERPTEMEGRMRFDLGPLNLQPKDTVIFQLEIIDNNTLTGPGRTLSEEIVFRVASPDDKHQKLVEQQQQLVEKLVLLLADYLETPVGERVVRGTNWVQAVPIELGDVDRKARLTASSAVVKRTGELLAEMNQLGEALKADPLMLERDVMIFTSLAVQLDASYQALTSTVERLAPLLDVAGPSVSQLQRLADEHVAMEEVLEKGILRLEDLLASQKMEMVKATTEEIKALKDRLRELLEKYRDTQDPELKEAIKREIGRLRQRMSELMRRMQDQLQRLPEEHVNLDALKTQQMESDAKKMADAMTSIEQMLDNNDIDGALAELDKMDASLDQLTKDMDEQFGQAQPESMSELDKKVSQLMDQVNDLEALQQEVERNTSEAHGEALKKSQAELDQMVKREAAPVLEEIQEQRRTLQKMQERELSDNDQEDVSRAMRRLEDMERALRTGDVEASLERATQSLEDLRSLKFGMDLSFRYTPGDTKEGRDLEKSSAEMPGLLERGKKIRSTLEDMKEQASKMMASPGAEAMEELKQGQERVNQQAEKLSQQIAKASEEFPMLGEQMRPSADAARQHMGGAGSHLGQEQLQPAMDEQRQALDQLQQLKEAMKNTLGRQKQGSNGKTSNEKVQIPEQDDRSKETFRDDVMKNMREGRLENYDEEIRRYYESLME